jgi:hypothetical protein
VATSTMPKATQVSGSQMRQVCLNAGGVQAIHADAPPRFDSQNSGTLALKLLVLAANHQRKPPFLRPCQE